MVGQRVSHYEILQKLGEGGMGQVYKARDLKLNRFVALKFLASSLLDSTSAHARFLQEARAISALNHPNIATIYDVEESEEGPFLVLEYLGGGTLRAKVQQNFAIGRKLPVEQVVGYAWQMACGLAHAHRSGIVHRDVKTSNAILNTEGTVKITDFGLAKFRDSSRITLAGSAFGTPAYMSPEQAEGEDADFRSDIFSFGVVLYELSTGELPFRGDNNSAVIYQIVHASPRPPEEVRADLPEPLRQVIRVCLEKKPEGRYQSMEELLVDLRPLRTELGIVSTDPGAEPTMTMPPHRSAGHTSGRRQFGRWAVAALALAALLGGIGLVVSQRTLPRAKQVVVLPFTNVGGDPAYQAFCDGLVETLTTMLTQLEQFHGSLLVVPASEVRRELITGARQAQQMFGANLVISGSVQRSGDRIRLTANLVDTKTVLQVASRTVDTQMEDPVALQDGVVAQVAELLEIHLQPDVRQSLAAGSTKTPQAYDLYLQGRGYLQRFDNQGNYEDAIPRFQQAIKLDPNYALAYAGLAEGYLRKYELTRDLPWLEQARAAGGRAIELNDRVSAAHINLGVIQTIQGHYDDAFREFRRALELDRVSASAYREMAKAYAAAGQVQEAEATYQRAIGMHPNDWLGYKDLGAFYVRYARYSAAEAPFRKVLELTPDNYIGYRNLGALYHFMDRQAEAEGALNRSIAIKPTNLAYLNLGTLYFFQGRYAEAASMDEKAVALGSNDYVIWGNLADAYRWAPGLAGKAPETYRRAIQTAEEQLRITPSDPSLLASLAVYWGKLGNSPKALGLAEESRRLAPKQPWVHFKSALIYELAGDRDRALAALAEALRDGYSPKEVRGEPELNKLRKDPRYDRIVRQSEPSTTR